MKLLVIEDDHETAAYLAKGRRERLYGRSHRGRARGLVPRHLGSYDAIVLDRMLPGMDGLALLGALRGARIQTPALILSALGSVDDRVKGLRSGGDDYLAKPFAFTNCWPGSRCCSGAAAMSQSDAAPGRRSGARPPDPLGEARRQGNRAAARGSFSCSNT